ncbi:MAG: PAS domain-containing protein, partial [Anaerolineae bacterium]|nr:PAS domain-containing protein [Anaerolineae bacterium]
AFMSENHYRNLFETTTSPIFIASVTGKLVDVNPAWVRLFGFSRNVALRKKISDLFNEPSQYARFWKKLNADDAVTDFEGAFLIRGDKIVDCLITAAVRRDQQGQIVGYQGIMRDITLEKRSQQQNEVHHRALEQKVAERTAQLEAQVKQLTAVNFIMQMVASARDTQTALETVAREMVHLFDVHSSGITLLNDARTELSVVAYYSRDTTTPSAVGTVIPLDGNPASVQVVETGKSIVVHKPQESYLTQASHALLRERNTTCMLILPLLARGRVIGTIGLDTDLPERSFTADEVLLAELIAAQLAGIIQNVRLLDKDLQQAYKRLKELDRLKSSFIGIITHELRSPFVAANLSVQLLYRYMEAGMYDELLDQIKRLDQELVEGHRMIDSLISFASLMSKQGELFFEETDLTTLASDATAHLARLVEARHIHLTFNFPPDLPLVYLDQQRISEAIHHLVHNAIKFNKADGSVDISSWSTSSKIFFEVKDTGVGVPPEKLDTIWTAFTQTVDDLKRGLEGLGLGLALVKSAVEAHGGKVTAISKVGQGSTFGFWLPLHPQK